MQSHTHYHTDHPIAIDDITDVDTDSNILSSPEEEDKSDVASFDEDDMYGSDNEEDIVVSFTHHDGDDLVATETPLVEMVCHSTSSKQSRPLMCHQV